MTPTPDGPPWFALSVKPNHEKTVERGLESRGYQTYVPVQHVTRRWSDRTKQMASVVFPGYVFCRVATPELNRVLTQPGVRSVVSFGRNPAPVEEAEISSVRALISSGRPIVPCPYIRLGQRVIVGRGPLAYLRGMVLRIKDSWRVVVSVEALGCSVSIEVDPESLCPDECAYASQ